MMNSPVALVFVVVTNALFLQSNLSNGFTPTSSDLTPTTPRAKTCSNHPLSESSPVVPSLLRQLPPKQSNTQLVLAATATQRNVDEWEVAEYEEKPPTDIEKFLSTRYPEFFYLLQKNEDVMKVVRSDAAQRQNGVTFFAPNSKAFEELGTKKLSQLDDERNAETAAKMGAFHVIEKEAVSYIRLTTEDWTKGRPKDGSKPAFTIEGVATMGGNVPVGRSAQDEGWFGTGWFAKRDGEDAVIGTNNARIVQSFTSKKGKWIVHEMSGLVSPALLWRYCDQLRIPGF